MKQQIQKDGQTSRRFKRITIEGGSWKPKKWENLLHEGFSTFFFLVSNVWYNVWDRGDVNWLTRSYDFVIHEQQPVISIMTAMEEPLF